MTNEWVNEWEREGGRALEGQMDKFWMGGTLKKNYWSQIAEKKENHEKRIKFGISHN